MPELRDDSGLACAACWQAFTGALAAPGGTRCAACQAPAARTQCLHLRRFDHPQSWRLCAAHAVAFLNGLRTVEPKFDPATFRFPGG